MLYQYDVPITKKEAEEKLKERFRENAHVTDVRVVDILIMKGQMELDEVMEHWMGNMHVMKFFKDTQPEKPSDFLSKFYQGVE
uniref:N-terminal Ras-GEF domain-containing protein n=1 Tax=Pinctada fucata TaxID=50426 RepID=A0A194AJ97_PINFU